MTELLSSLGESKLTSTLVWRIMKRISTRFWGCFVTFSCAWRWLEVVLIVQLLYFNGLHRWEIWQRRSSFMSFAGKAPVSPVEALSSEVSLFTNVVGGRPEWGSSWERSKYTNIFFLSWNWSWSIVFELVCENGLLVLIGRRYVYLGLFDTEFEAARWRTFHLFMFDMFWTTPSVCPEWVLVIFLGWWVELMIGRLSSAMERKLLPTSIQVFMRTRLVLRVCNNCY